MRESLRVYIRLCILMVNFLLLISDHICSKLASCCDTIVFSYSLYSSSSKFVAIVMASYNITDTIKILDWHNQL